MPSWGEVRRYLDKPSNGWELYKQTDHDYYRKILTDGNVLTTRVSRGSGEVPPNLWKRILRQQLQISQEEFNKAK